MDNVDSKYTFRNFIYLMIVVLAVWLIYASLLYLLSDKWDHRGAFGDMFGAVNALFSGFAFAGIIFTILLQREELRLQREELKLTRNELKRTASAQEISQQALSKQAETLQTTAHINAINTLIAIYQSLPGEHTSANQRAEIYTKSDNLRVKLEDLVGVLEKE